MHSTVAVLVTLPRGRGYQTPIINEKIIEYPVHKYIVYKCIAYSGTQLLFFGGIEI